MSSLSSSGCVDGLLVTGGDRRQGEPEPSSITGVGVDADRTAVQLNDFLAHGQPDTRSGVGVSAMQSLEYHEHLLDELRRNADAVVGDGNYPLAVVVAGARFAVDCDARRAVLMPKLDGVANQVLPQHREKCGVTDDLGKGLVPPDEPRPGLLDRGGQIGQS